MLGQYMKQAWRLLRENPVLSAISIIGTALAICMIMVVVMSYEVENAAFPPETKRDRMLYMQTAGKTHKEGRGSADGPIALELAKECFKAMETPEAVTIVSVNRFSLLASAQGMPRTADFDFMTTDEAFWQVFDFSFIDGKPYTEADFKAGLRKTVITEKVALTIFGTTQVAGKTILLNYTDYTVSGVVRNISSLASAAYSQIWMPYTSREVYPDNKNRVTGGYRVYILAHSPADFPAIREEAELLRKKYDDGLADSEHEVNYRGQPDTHFVHSNRKFSSEAPNIKRIVTQYIALIALLLLVPAVNLSSMTGSRMRKRLPEFGVRRSFGATRRGLMSQTLWESLLQTFLGGLLGLALSVFAAYLLKDVIFMNSGNAYQLGENSLSPGVLLNPAVFLYAFLFCVLLNLLSATIPAWRVSRKQIVEAIHSN